LRPAAFGGAARRLLLILFDDEVLERRVSGVADGVLLFDRAELERPAVSVKSRAPARVMPFV